MKKTIGISVLVWMFFISCAKKKAQDVQRDGGFPNKIGTTFVYAVTDSASNQSYNVNVTIKGNSTLANGTPVQVWTYNYPDRVDTNYISINKDSVVFYDNMNYITNRYNFPLTVGEKWSKPYKQDTTTVIGTQPLTTKAGYFPQTFLLEEHTHAENYSSISYQWFVPTVGMVKMHIKQLTFGFPQVQTWELISYSFN
jgi:hypothetical protein